MTSFLKIIKISAIYCLDELWTTNLTRNTNPTHQRVPLTCWLHNNNSLINYLTWGCVRTSISQFSINYALINNSYVFVPHKQQYSVNCKYCIWLSAIGLGCTIDVGLEKELVDDENGKNGIMRGMARDNHGWMRIGHGECSGQWWQSGSVSWQRRVRSWIGHIAARSIPKEWLELGTIKRCWIGKRPRCRVVEPKTVQLHWADVGGVEMHHQKLIAFELQVAHFHDLVFCFCRFFLFFCSCPEIQFTF